MELGVPTAFFSAGFRPNRRHGTALAMEKDYQRVAYKTAGGPLLVDLDLEASTGLSLRFPPGGLALVS